MAIDPQNPVAPEFPRQAGRENVPSHVPEYLIRESEIPFGPNFLKDPYHYMASMHETLPRIFYGTSVYGNSWQITKYEDAITMLQEYKVFSNEGATPFPRDPNDYFYFLPIEVDPPDHRKYRKILDPVFSPKGIANLEEDIRSLTNQLIDKVIDSHQCDFTTAFARPEIHLGDTEVSKDLGTNSYLS